MNPLRRPHHDPSEYYVSNPAPDPGETVTVSVEVPASGGFDRLALRTVHDGEARWHEGEAETTPTGCRWRFPLPCHNETIKYRFWCDSSSPEGPSPHWLTGVGLVNHDPADHFDFRLTTTGATPRWVPETVWYQIFPDRFASSDPGRPLPSWATPSQWHEPVRQDDAAMTQIYGGDLDGIASRLDYLTDLGVGGIYLTPVFPARSNHRYDAVSFDRVDDILGGDQALARLRTACDRAGLRLMTDLTLNHTGNHHEWFEAAQADPAAPEAGFYYFNRHPDDYASWLDVRSLPKLNHRSSELRRRFYEGPESVLSRFLADPFRMDGWRIDVANMTARYGLIDDNRAVRRAARATSDFRGPDRWLLGEHFFDHSGDADGPGWHGVMNYSGVAKPVASWLGNFTTLATMAPGPGQDPRPGQAVAQTMDEARASVPWQFVIGSMGLLGSHDTARWLTMAQSKDLAKVGVGLLLTLPGSPSIFYGDEIGLRADSAELARTPMPWHQPETWDHDLLNWYRSLIQFRSSSPALAHGGFRWAQISAESLSFLRETGNQRLLIHASRSASSPATFSLDDLAATDIELVAGHGELAPPTNTTLTTPDGPSFSIWLLR